MWLSTVEKKNSSVQRRRDSVHLICPDLKLFWLGNKADVVFQVLWQLLTQPNWFYFQQTFVCSDGDGFREDFMGLLAFKDTQAVEASSEIRENVSMCSSSGEKVKVREETLGPNCLFSPGKPEKKRHFYCKCKVVNLCQIFLLLSSGSSEPRYF